MKVVDLHPEDLLDKEAHGELTESERERLDAHLERCATCRFEREARADFAAELDEDRAEISVQRLLAMVEEERKESIPAPRAGTDEPVAKVANEKPEKRSPDEDDFEPIAPAPSSRRGRRLGRIVMLFAAALLVGGVATAQGGGHVWAQISALWTDAPEVELTARSTPPSAPTTKSFATAASAMPIHPEHTTAPADEAEATSAATSAAPPPTVLAPPPAIVESSKTLFDAMGEARRQGDYPRVMALHRRLQAEYPRSREAHVSHATIGRLLLDRGDSAAALESFDAYQARGSGALDEAVLVGRATALDRLGRSDEARASWQALLVAFPETPYAEHARMRTGGARVP